MQTQASTTEIQKLVTFTVADQLFGIAVNKVLDILAPEKIAPIPLAPVQVSGAINVRGKIVTVIDVRSRLSLEKAVRVGKATALTVEHNAALYTLLVDRVGDVVEVPRSAERETLSMPDRQWRDIATGLVQMHDSVIVVMDVDKFLNL